MQSPVLCVASLLLPYSPLLPSLPAFPPTEIFSTSFHRHVLSFFFSISPLTNKQVAREPLFHSFCEQLRKDTALSGLCGDLSCTMIG